MHRFFLSLAVLMLLPFGAGAQDSFSVSRELDATPWHFSSNAAGLAEKGLPNINSAGFLYDYKAGEFRLLPEGQSVGDLRFDTEGTTRIGKMTLWGKFAYDRISEKGASFNTMLYDPFDERFLYHVADSVESGWKKQSYDMRFKAAMPLGEHFSAGLEAAYIDKIAAKQNDPRAETYHYDLYLKPGVTLKAGKCKFGINGTWSHTFVRSSPSLANNTYSQPVYILHGLGNYIGEIIGGNSLSTMYHKSDSYGGGVQMEYAGSSWSVLTEVTGLYSLSTTVESPTNPRLYGTTKKTDFGLNAFLRWGRGNALDLKAGFVRTIGIEPTTVWNIQEGTWDVAIEVAQCNFITWTGEMEYRKNIGENTRLRGSLGYIYKEDRYAIPPSRFAYSTATISAGAERRFVMGSSYLLTSLDLGLRKLIFGQYGFNGYYQNGAPARDWYPHDIDVLAGDALTQKLFLGWNFPAGKSLRMECSLRGGVAELLAAPKTEDAMFSVGTKRLSITGGLSLYF